MMVVWLLRYGGSCSGNGLVVVMVVVVVHAFL